MDAFNPYDCEHPKEAIRFRRRSNGVVMCVVQCLVCGRELRGVRRTDPARLALTEQEPFDEQLLQQGEEAYRFYRQQRHMEWQSKWQAEQEQREAERQAADAERRRQYSAYLLTPQWREKRQRVLERDEYLCQACRKRRATQVHHLTYTHIFNEPLFDLVSICTVCHEALHASSAEEAA
jgi:hypothetical protein